jgi:hypothetical protein
MNHCNSGRGPITVAILLVLAGAPLAPAQTEGRSVTVGLNTSCPYGPAYG